ncbi:MAG: hypothetical protein A3E31_14125 [Candidatus Rokubacteria bacterium RIFCSPHIGHO2_12_FULL_73_22]|nr:MAG: hypothetical protein A3E31_14125 [Candidatus Rokubacteria bacterium RIFCSPHIGHO2_12_FULL_73_22]
MSAALLLLASLAGLGPGAVADAAERLRYLTAVYLDDKGGGMRWPEGVACSTSALVVADTGRGRLLRYTLEGRDVKPAGELVAPQLAAPLRVQIDSRGDVFALDGKQRRIVRFGAKGELKGYLTPEGVPEPATIVPRSFKIDANDAIHVLDVFGARVLVLGPDGKYQRHLPFPEAYGFFSDLAVGRNGTIYLLDSVTAALSAAPRNARDFTPLGKSLRTHLSFATSIAVDGRGVLYVVDENGSGIVLVGPDGSVLGRQLAMGWTEGLLYNPSQMCLNDKGQVFIADRGNSRVQVFAIVR